MTAALFHDEPAECPQCGRPGPLPIVYGTPSEEMRLAARLGYLVLGEDHSPPGGGQWVCPGQTCRYEF